MVIVSADPRAPAAGGKPDASHPAPAAATPAAGAKGAAPTGQTVTIIDGMSGKRQEVTIPTGDGKTQAPPIERRRIETSRHGALPKIAPDGARPADVYARPLEPTLDKVAGPRVAIVIGGLGIGAASTYEALGKLPGPVTF